jgi:hypothetical protein
MLHIHVLILLLIFTLPTNAHRLLVTPILSALPCVTVTKTTTHSSCPPTTPSNCPIPDCIELSILDIPCGCPTVVPTYTTYTACHTQCEEGCGVFYETNIASCATSPPPPPTTSTTYTSTSTISSTLSTITTPPPHQPSLVHAPPSPRLQAHSVHLLHVTR